MPSTKEIVSIASALIIGVPLFGYVILNYDNIVDERVLAIETSIQKNPDYPVSYTHLTLPTNREV